MEKASVLTQMLDRLRQTRHRQREAVPSTTRLMSDRELAVAIREIRRNSAAQTSERARESLSAALEVLRDPAPDTFLGRKTQTPFPKEDDAYD